MQTTIPKEILAIGEHLRTQDNLATASPIFCVQVLERIGPIDVDSTDNYYFYDSEDCTPIYVDGADPDEFRRCEVLDDHDLLPDHITKHGYKEQWITVTSCFTRKAATNYIEATKHRYTEYFDMRVYVDTLLYNDEMIALRSFLLSLTPEQEAELPFPEGLPELPPLPAGKTRWVYRGTFSGVYPDCALTCIGRHIAYWDGDQWCKTDNFSTLFHHIEAI